MEKHLLGRPESEDITVYEPCGCALCNETGYYGRIGVYEIIEMTPELRQIITERGTTEQIKAMALSQGMHTLRMSAADYVLEGITTVDEMLKVSFEN